MRASCTLRRAATGRPSVEDSFPATSTPIAAARAHADPSAKRATGAFSDVSRTGTRSGATRGFCLAEHHELGDLALAHRERSPGEPRRAAPRRGTPLPSLPHSLRTARGISSRRPPDAVQRASNSSVSACRSSPSAASVPRPRDHSHRGLSSSCLSRSPPCLLFSAFSLPVCLSVCPGAELTACVSPCRIHSGLASHSEASCNTAAASSPDPRPALGADAAAPSA